MDSIDPISAAFARGGRLIMLEHMADYAQNPYSGIRYFESVERKLGRAETAEFARRASTMSAPARLPMSIC